MKLTVHCSNGLKGADNAGFSMSLGGSKAQILEKLDAVRVAIEKVPVGEQATTLDKFKDGKINTASFERFGVANVVPKDGDIISVDILTSKEKAAAVINVVGGVPCLVTLTFDKDRAEKLKIR